MMHVKSFANYKMLYSGGIVASFVCFLIFAVLQNHVAFERPILWPLDLTIMLRLFQKLSYVS